MTTPNGLGLAPPTGLPYFRICFLKKKNYPPTLSRFRTYRQEEHLTRALPRRGRARNRAGGRRKPSTPRSCALQHVGGGDEKLEYPLPLAGPEGRQRIAAGRGIDRRRRFAEQFFVRPSGTVCGKTGLATGKNNPTQPSCAL